MRRRREWELAPDQQLVADELEHLADTAPPSRRADEIRMLVLHEADERAAAAPAGMGIIGAAVVSLALAVLFGLGAAYVGSFVRDLDAPGPTNAASPTIEPAPSNEPRPTLETPGPEATPTPAPRADDAPSTEPEPALPEASPDPDDDGPPPHVSPSGPPSPMPGPPGGTRP